VSAQTRSEIRELLERHGRRPRKALGQHFLADPNITDKIVRLAGVGEGDLVVEIGPGTGTLTSALAHAGAQVIAYEVDEGLAPILAETVGAIPNADVRFEDATDVDFADIDRDWVLVANLPYNVGTPIVLDVLRHAPRCRRVVVMVQEEVADRFVAEPGTKDYGIPSVVVGLTAKPGGSFKVPAQVFVPPPNVGSAVIVLDRDGVEGPVERAIELASAAFGQRRKMLRQSLKGALADPVSVCEAAGIAPTSRAEELAPADWLRLAEAA
jgi:16S rRNA (adenine1518-N6/adenine1519-N6)-dimethyltransferase